MNIVVTGSSTGIGQALCQRLLKRGHQVCGLARSDQSVQAQSLGPAFRGFRCDVSRWEDLELVAKQVDESWGRIDALVCAAGIQGEVGRTLQADPAHWCATVRVNLEGTFLTLRAFAALLNRAQGRAKVVCFSGGGATKPRPHFSAYGSSKTGVVRLVETIAEEEKGRPLDINAIAPGAIHTRLTDEVIALGPEKAGQAEYQAALKQKAGGGASLDRALDCVEWLLSGASDGLSGRLISAPWDPWEKLGAHVEKLGGSDAYTLRRILPEERGISLG